MNFINSPGWFQDRECIYGGRLSHVSSQLKIFQCLRVLLSRENELPLDTPNQSGVQETIFEIKLHVWLFPRLLSTKVHPKSGIEIEKQYRRIFHPSWKQLWQVKTAKFMSQFQCRCLRQDCLLILVLDIRGWTAKRAHWGTIRRVP